MPAGLLVELLLKRLLPLVSLLVLVGAAWPDHATGIYQQSCPPVMPCEATYSI